MKKNKGFTLIELLAVIVVLAIIALIATPIVMNTINNAKKGAAERSADSYIKQVETSIVENRVQTGNTISDGKYSITDDGNLVKNGATLVINMNGNKPSSGIVMIKNGQVVSASSMIIGDYKVSYNSSDNKYVVTEAAISELETLCKKDDGVDLNNLQYGDKFTCDLGDGEEKTFYVLKDGDLTVSLIMNMNIDSNGKGTTSGNTVAWLEKGATGNVPVTANAYLKSSTENWILSESQISLPTATQIAKANGNSTTNLKDWLLENLNAASAPWEYWTSTLDTSGSFTVANAVAKASKSITQKTVSNTEYVGVRPVITLYKVNPAKIEYLCTAVTELSTQQVVTDFAGEQIESIQTGVLASVGNPYAYGVEYSCKLSDEKTATFYVLEDGDDTDLGENGIAKEGQVSLIMNENLTKDGEVITTSWISNDDYKNNGGKDLSDEVACKYGNQCAGSDLGPITANNVLKKNTASWTKLDKTQISLPTLHQISAAAGNQTSNLPSWLYENNAKNYWTSTANSTSANIITHNGITTPIDVGNTNGIRPVITIPKVQMKSN